MGMLVPQDELSYDREFWRAMQGSDSIQLSSLNQGIGGGHCISICLLKTRVTKRRLGSWGRHVRTLL